MSMDCDDNENFNNNISQNSCDSKQATGMMMSTDNDNTNSNNTFKSISYQDSMEIDNSTKRRTLFSILIDKRNEAKRNRKKSRNKSPNKNSNSNNNNKGSNEQEEEDLRNKLTSEELRVVKDLKEISDSKWCARGTIVTIHLSSRLHNFKCTISPAEGYYRDGTFSFHITIDKNYPYSPPLIRACHPIFHPNINSNTFEIGLPILRSDWKAVLSLNDVLFALQLLFMEPNIDPITPSSNDCNDCNDSNHTEAKNNDSDNDDAMSSSNHIRNHISNGKAMKHKINKYSFGVNNHKPSYIPHIIHSNRSNSNSSSNSSDYSTDSVAVIQNMESAVMFRDYPIQFEKTCQQIIRGGINMFGTNWQCIERKKMKNIFVQNNNSEKYDPSIGSQSFRLKDSDTTITKKCSVLRKRRRNESDDCDTFSMENVKKALRCFSSTTGSIRDGIHSDCSDHSQSSLINGVSSIEIETEPPEKKRRINKVSITECDINTITGGFNLQNINTIKSIKNINYKNNNGNGINIIQSNGMQLFGIANNQTRNNNRNQNNQNKNISNHSHNIANGFIAFDFPWNKNNNSNRSNNNNNNNNINNNSENYDDDFNMQI